MMVRAGTVPSGRRAGSRNPRQPSSSPNADTAAVRELSGIAARVIAASTVGDRPAGSGCPAGATAATNARKVRSTRTVPVATPTNSAQNAEQGRPHQSDDQERRDTPHGSHRSQTEHPRRMGGPEQKKCRHQGGH